MCYQDESDEFLFIFMMKCAILDHSKIEVQANAVKVLFSLP